MYIENRLYFLIWVFPWTYFICFTTEIDKQRTQSHLRNIFEKSVENDDKTTNTHKYCYWNDITWHFLGRLHKWCDCKLSTYIVNRLDFLMRNISICPSFPPFLPHFLIHSLTHSHTDSQALPSECQVIGILKFRTTEDLFSN